MATDPRSLCAAGAVYDLSLPLRDGLPGFPGDPSVHLTRIRQAAADGYNLMALALTTHNGTHADMPLHFVSEGADATSVPLDRFVGEAVVADLPRGERGIIDVSDLAGLEVRRDDIFLAYTGWDERVGTPAYFTAYPTFSAAAARWLINAGVKAVGCDTPSVDALDNEAHTVHHLLLGAGVVIIELLVHLRPLRGQRVFFVGVPLKIVGGDGSPIRALAMRI